MTPTPDRRDFGHIFQRPRSPYWQIRYTVDGKRITESTGSTNAREAEKLLRTRQAEMGLGVFLAPDVKRTTFADLAQMIRDDYTNNRRKSGERLDASLKRLGAAFGSARASSLTPDRLARYVADRLTAGAAPATVRNELNALRRAFRLAHRAGKVATIPAFPTLAPGAARTGFVEDADLPGLLAELSPALRPLVHFLALTGWRVSEARGLTWDRVDFAAGVVTLAVGSTKTGAGRVFPFAALPELAALLQTQRDATKALERATGQIVRWVFHRHGQPVRDFFAAWKAATIRAGHPGLLVHDLRRSAVRRFVRAGIPERVAMSLSGHKSRSVFDRYNIVSERDLSENVAKLAALTPQSRTVLPLRDALGTHSAVAAR
jgi:integrase